MNVVQMGFGVVSYFENLIQSRQKVYMLLQSSSQTRPELEVRVYISSAT